MTFRLLAFILAILVGSPLCWCCQQSLQAASSAPSHSCCHRSSQEKSGKEPRQPCPHCVEKRLVSVDTAKVPGAVLTVLSTVDFRISVELLAPSKMEDAPRVEPPNVRHRPPVPLFVRHCAWLI